MPEQTSAPDAERPIGRFITDRVLPQWDDLNEYPGYYRHNRVVNRAMGRQALQVREMGGLHAAIMFNGRVVGGRLGRQTTLVSDQAAEACSRKSLTRAYWKAAGVPTQGGRLFRRSEAESAEQFVAAAPAPVVVKPDGGRRGAGVSFRVTEVNFRHSWTKALRAGRTADGDAGVLIEDFQDQLCLRFFVVGGQVRGVTLRVPLFVVGDGVSPVQQLLEASFAHQHRNALLRATRPKITAELIAGSGLVLEDVPAEGVLHILNENPHLVYGGLPYDVTTQVCQELNSLAADAALAIPGLGAVGIDILTPALDNAEGAVALDADSWATLLMHGYPAFGPRRIIGRPIANQLRLRADHWNRPTYSSPAQVAESSDE